MTKNEKIEEDQKLKIVRGDAIAIDGHWLRWEDVAVRISNITDITVSELPPNLNPLNEFVEKHGINKFLTKNSTRCFLGGIFFGLASLFQSSYERIFIYAGFAMIVVGFIFNYTAHQVITSKKQSVLFNILSSLGVSNFLSNLSGFFYVIGLISSLMFLLSHNIFCLLATLLGAIIGNFLAHITYQEPPDRKVINFHLISGRSHSIIFESESFMNDVLDILANVFEVGEGNFFIDMRKQTIENNYGTQAKGNSKIEIRGNMENHVTIGSTQTEKPAKQAHNQAGPNAHKSRRSKINGK